MIPPLIWWLVTSARTLSHHLISNVQSVTCTYTANAHPGMKMYCRLRLATGVVVLVENGDDQLLNFIASIESGSASCEDR